MKNNIIMEDKRVILNKLYSSAEDIRDIQKKNIGFYLNKLKHNDFKVKHIKKLYQIYNMLYLTRKVMIRNEDFDFTDTSINDFYKYLGYSIGSIRGQIYSFIRLFSDDDFDNNQKIKNRLNFKYSDYMKFEERFL